MNNSTETLYKILGINSDTQQQSETLARGVESREQIRPVEDGWTVSVRRWNGQAKEFKIGDETAAGVIGLLPEEE